MAGFLLEDFFAVLLGDAVLFLATFAGLLLGDLVGGFLVRAMLLLRLNGAYMNSRPEHLALSGRENDVLPRVTGSSLRQLQLGAVHHVALNAVKFGTRTRPSQGSTS